MEFAASRRSRTLVNKDVLDQLTDRAESSLV